MPDAKFNQDVANLDARGKQRYGEKPWADCIDAIAKSVPGGIPEAAMAQILTQPDPANFIFTAGREALLNRADGGDKEAEYAFAQIRQAEREQHRKLKGRG
jgi:hypothetical protein